jgi:hypothetical protein
MLRDVSLAKVTGPVGAASTPHAVAADATPSTSNRPKSSGTGGILAQTRRMRICEQSLK